MIFRCTLRIGKDSGTRLEDPFGPSQYYWDVFAVIKRKKPGAVPLPCEGEAGRGLSKNLKI
jgi:hypothetical protein